MDQNRNVYSDFIRSLRLSRLQGRLYEGYTSLPSIRGILTRTTML